MGSTIAITGFTVWLDLTSTQLLNHAIKTSPTVLLMAAWASIVIVKYHRTVLIAWFNDCILGKSGQIANPTIVKVDPVPYYSIRTHLCLRIY